MSDRYLVEFLKRKKFDIKNLPKLLEGKFGVNPCEGRNAKNFCINNSNSHPILRHGMDLAKLLDDAITCRGPGDPILERMILNEDLAEKAFHVSKALTHALYFFKKRNDRKRPYPY